MKFVLGTAQFGMKYGVTNSNGIPSDQVLKKIINFANKREFVGLDCAFSYGNVHKRLSNFDLKNLEITTKINLSSEQSPHFQITKSMRDLKVSNISNVLTHDTNFSLWSKERLNEFKKLKLEGLCGSIGASIYSISDFNTLMSHFCPDIIQIPLNVFDQRFISSGVIKECERNQIRVQVRSIFLQGVLLNSDLIEKEKYQINLDDEIQSWNVFLQRKSLQPLIGCMAFIKSCPHDFEVIVGCSNFSEIKAILYAWDEAPQLEFKEFAHLAVNDFNLVDPRSWKI